MAQKFFTDNSLSMLVNKIKSYVDNVVNIIATDKADKEHGHDDTYYTKIEMDSALSSKANKSHDHDNEYDKKGSASTVQNELNSHMSNTSLHFTTAEKTKLSGVETGAQKNTITGVKGNSESSYRTGNVNITKANIGLGNVDNTSDANKPVSTAQQEAMDSLFAQAKKYADDKDALLLNNSSTAVDSIMELATAMAENEDVVDALEQAIGTKAKASDLTSHTSNKSNPHGITKEQLSLGDVENKSSATIRSEITKSNVTNALGYTPYTQTEVDSLLDGKVDKVSGKGLSTNDYTTAEKTKLSGIAEGAQANVIESIKVNGKVQSISSKSVNITVPTKAEDIGAAKSSHGTHVTWSTTSPKMNGTATVGTETKVARGDHVHPTDTSRASQADLDALEEIVENHTHKYAGSSSAGGVATSAAKLATARKIGDTTFDGTADISLENIIGCGYCSSTSDTNQGKYQKFARINVSDAAWSGCFGTFIVKDVESNHINGQLNFHARSISTIATVSVNLTWLNVTTGYESSVVAVKVSDGIYDLYYKSVGAYEIASFRLIDCKHRNKITLYGNQGWVDSVTVAATSALAGHVQIANVANKLNTNAGSATQPIYFKDGVPVATTYALNKTVPSDAKFTDTNNAVTQTITTTNANYRVLLSATADDTTRTEGARKDANFYYNPSTNALSVGSIVMGDATISYDTTEKAIVFNFE